MNPIVVSCLLYLGAISPNASYSTCTMNSIEQQYHVQIEQIENNPVQLGQVVHDYGDEASSIDIIQIEGCN